MMMKKSKNKFLSNLYNPGKAKTKKKKRKKSDGRETLSEIGPFRIPNFEEEDALLAAGIWEALLTTAFGLAVALPFSILAAVFNNAVDNTRDLLEDALTEIMVRSATGASAKG